MNSSEQSLLKKSGGVLTLLIFFVMLAFIFRDAISVMLDGWQKDEYSHGYLIPILSLVLLLNKLSELGIKNKTSWLGFYIVLFGILSQFAFQFAGVKGILPQIYLISFTGLIILFTGTSSFRPLFGAFFLLFLSAPLPKFLYYTLSFNMQMLSTSLGTSFLTLLQIPVFQDGNVIDLGGYQLQVVEACSGLRYLFPLLSLSFLLAYMYRTSLWKRAIVFFSAAPIAIFMNGFRIAVIGVTVDRWGIAMAEGVVHDFEGWIVFAGCTALLLLEVFLLNKIGRKGEMHFDDLRIPTLKGLPRPAIGKPTAFCALILVAGVVTSAVLPAFLSDYLKPVPLKQHLSSFPLQIGEWVGRAGTLDEKALKVLGTDEYFIADYTKPNTPSVNLYALYYAQQDSTSNQAVHSPSVCIPGGGWTVESKTTKTISLQNQEQLTVNRLLISKEGIRQVVYYWFVQDGHVTADPNYSRIYMIKNAITKGKTNGAIIRIVTEIVSGETEQEAEERSMSLVVNFYELLMTGLFKQ